MTGQHNAVTRKHNADWVVNSVIVGIIVLIEVITHPVRGEALGSQACPAAVSVPLNAPLAAIEALDQQWAALEPQCAQSAQFHWARGLVSALLGRFEVAALSMEAAMLRDATLAGLMFDYALVRERLGDWPSARSLYQALLQDHQPPEAIAAYIRARLADIDTGAAAAKASTIRPAAGGSSGAAGEQASRVAAGKDQPSWRGSISMLLGYEQNLNSAPNLSEFAFTTLDGPIVLALDPKDRPQSSQVGHFDLRSGSSWALPGDQRLALSLRASAKFTPRSVYQSALAEASAEYSWDRESHRWLSYLSLGHVRFGQAPLANSLRTGLAREHQLTLGETTCSVQQGAELETRRYLSRNLLDGDALYGGGRLLCSRNELLLESFMRAGWDQARDEQRAGGNQRRLDGGLAISKEIDLHRLRLQSMFSVTHDLNGYNPLIENNKVRKSLRISHLLEYSFRLPSTRLQWVFQAESNRQLASLSLFETSGWTLSTGLRQIF
ncbi:MAG: hypothetical protein EB069_02640 [Actinobacteria bacterium]|nr:hypothetical protein [Actinomycetota bacterium]